MGTTYQESGVDERTQSAEATAWGEPQKEHGWLRKFIGAWSYEAETRMRPGAPVEKSSGTERIRALGELWIVAEAQGEMHGAPATMLMTLGFDPAKKQFVSSWAASMMSHLWVSTGALDAAEKVLTLEAEGPGMDDDGTMARYRDVFEFKSDEQRVTTSYVLGKDGKWQPFMTATYRRMT